MVERREIKILKVEGSFVILESEENDN